jgi:hypothetical protein
MHVSRHRGRIGAAWRAGFVLSILAVPLGGCGSFIPWMFGFGTAGDYPPGITGNDTDPATDQRRANLHPPGFEGGVTVSARSAAVLPGKSSAFVRTGVLLPFDGRSGSSFQNVLQTASGTESFSEHWTIPLMAGVSVPAASLGIRVPNLSAEVFAGGQIKQRKLGLSLAESGFGVVGGVSASTTTTQLDPAIGVGLRYQFGKMGGIPTSIAMNLTADYEQPQSVSALSPNFPTVSYTASVPRGVNVSAGVALNFELYSPDSYSPAQPLLTKSR